MSVTYLLKLARVGVDAGFETGEKSCYKLLRASATTFIAFTRRTCILALFGANVLWLDVLPTLIDSTEFVKEEEVGCDIYSIHAIASSSISRQ